jgi:hypothetical protein
MADKGNGEESRPLVRVVHGVNTSKVCFTNTKNERFILIR